MPVTESVYLTIAEARAMIDRGIAKARELRQAGALAVVDAGGQTVALSRMDDAPLASVYVSRSKAHAAAVQGRPTSAFATGAHDRPEVFAAWQTLFPREPFPGPGGMPIVKGGRVVGGIATGGIGPYTEIPGLDPNALMVDGVQANAEDLVICTALEIPYASQPGERPLAYDRQPVRDDLPPLPLGLEKARQLADRAMAKASELHSPIGVAVVDELGRLVHVDRMDESSGGSSEMAEAKAITAWKFRRSTADLTEEFRGRSARMEAIEKLVRFTILAMGGGIPIFKDGHLIGAIGVSGSGAQAVDLNGRRVNDVDIATAALE